MAESTDIRGAVVEILVRAREDILRNMAQKNINASGRTAASIIIRETDRGFAIVGGNDKTHAVEMYPRRAGQTVQVSDTAPLPTLEIGRPAGRVPRGFYYIIKEWTREKGLHFGTESERQTFAYFLSRRIAREGTRRHEVPEDVYSTPAQQAAKALQTDLTLLVRTTIKEVIQANF